MGKSHLPKPEMRGGTVVAPPRRDSNRTSLKAQRQRYGPRVPRITAYGGVPNPANRPEPAGLERARVKEDGDSAAPYQSGAKSTDSGPPVRGRCDPYSKTQTKLGARVARRARGSDRWGHPGGPPGREKVEAGARISLWRICANQLVCAGMGRRGGAEILATADVGRRGCPCMKTTAAPGDPGESPAGGHSVR